jgi:hypothetical protein
MKWECNCIRKIISNERERMAMELKEEIFIRMGKQEQRKGRLTS